MTEDTSAVPFDAGQFMQATVDAPMATEYEICPEGLFPAMIGDFDEKAIQRHSFTYKQGPQAGQPGSMVKFNCPFSIQDETVKAQMERETVYADQQIILDTNELGQLDLGKGKNVKLGQIREALGQNAAGPWNIMNLRGAGPLLVQVVHEEFERKDKSKGKKAVVVRVAPMKA